MGRSVNKVTIIGTLGRDPELSYMPNGNAVINISVATDESYNDKQSGQKVERTEWHRLTAYGKLAEIIGQYLKKGRPIMVEGRLKLDQWEDKQTGQKRSKMGVTLENFQFLDSRGEGGGNGGGGGGGNFSGGATPASGGADPAAGGGGGFAEDDDVPI